MVVSKMSSVHDYDTSLCYIPVARIDFLPNRGRVLNAGKRSVPLIISRHASLFEAVKGIRLH